MPDVKRKQTTYTIPASEDDLRHVDALIDSYLPVRVTRASVMHTCLELGIVALEAQQLKKKGSK